MTSEGFDDIKEAKTSFLRDVPSLKANHEEADTRFILHALDACQQGYEQLIISCRDTDVLVPLIYVINTLCKEAWVSSGAAKAPKFIAVHDIALSGDLRHNFIPFMRSLDGCDTDSKLAGYGKTLT